jgi:hypothetical protein
MHRHVVDRFTLVRGAITFVLAVAFFLMVAVPATILGNLYARMDALSASVLSGNPGAAATELDEVTGFYRVSRSWGLRAVADYLFEDAFLHRAASAYLAGDYDRVILDLDGRVDDPRAAHVLGCARFRVAQRRYREISGRDAVALAKKNAIIREVIEIVNPDFERAVRADLSGRFANKWNYDLTSNVDAVRRSLEVPRVVNPPEPEQKLGAKSPVRSRRG